MYPKWIANVMVVPKKGGRLRVCVNYTDFNKACLKDSFPLPRIDQIIDATIFTRHDFIPRHIPWI